jgi:ABC-type dipeptide/oligopeptide/nickel transport system permease component
VGQQASRHRTVNMLSFLARRLAASVLFVIVVASSAFVLVRLAPGDAASDLAVTVADDAVVEAARARLGLDQPMHVQFGTWLAGLARLDLGQSSRFGRPVAGLVIDSAANTARLAGLALLAATVIALPLGILTGSRPGSALSVAVSALSVLILSCPPIIATLVLLFFAVATGVLSVEPGHLALPTLALALPVAASLERLQSQAVAEAIAQPGVLAAAARGISPARLLWVHAGRQALRPVLGIYGIVMATLFSGSIAVETITSWPGLGRLMFEALIGRDLFLVAGCALAGGVLIVAGNLVADLLRATADPRVRETA